MADKRTKTVTSVEDYSRLGLPMGMSVMPEGITCRVCGGTLDPHQKVTTQVCSMPNCQARLQSQRLAAAAHHLEVRNEGRDGERPLAYRRAGPVAVAAAERAGAPDLRTVAAAVVPFNAMPLSPLPAERRASFEEHLDEVIAKGFAPDYDGHLAEPEAHFAARDDIEPDDALPVAACCMACQGYCCLLGKDTNAFIGSLLIAYYRHRNPDAAPDEVKADYLSHLPEVSTQEGCVYQGPKGCTLPREMRADICNSYHCSGQEHMMSALKGREEPPHVAIVALATWHWESDDPEEVLHRALTITPEGEIAVHEDIPLPPMPPKASTR